jgi:hypothetical protein
VNTKPYPKIRGKTGGRNGKELEQFVCIDLEKGRILPLVK